MKSASFFAQINNTTMNGTSEPPPRKRVSQACQPCGLKKVKCDGTYPSCTPCRLKGLDCTYGVSKRRAANNIESPRTRPPPAFTPHQPQWNSANNSGGTATRDQGTNKHEVQREIPRKSLSVVSGEASKRLFETFFNCIHPLWPILYKPLYSSLDFNSPADSMPPALVAAVFAIASCVDRPQQHAPNTIIQRCPEPAQFFEESLDLLTQEKTGKPQLLNALTPSILKCQVLTILSLQQHGVAEYARAAILCGLASAMAIELRLHRPRDDDPIQREVQSRLWWNLYILEKMMSTEMGRPVLLRAEESDVPFPSVSEADEFELMSSQHGKDGQGRNTPIKLRTISGLHSAIKLSMIAERLSREVYGLAARKAIRDNQASGEAKRLMMWTAMRDWEKEMEASPLKLDMSNDLTSVPAAVTNYVIMWHITILLHRPFIARWPSGSNARGSPDPLNACLEAANKICMVLEKYFDRLLGLPCDMIFSVFTAASTLLYHSKNSKEAVPETTRRLRLCIHWLSVLGKSWKSAGARHKLLADMFDLPRELKDQASGDAMPLGPATPYGQPSQSVQHIAISMPAGNGSSSGQGQSPEDWTFLRDFGDSTDEFYALDVQLRGLLDGGLESANVGLIG